MSIYVNETNKYYEKLEDAFKEYLKERNCETCGKHCAGWMFIDEEKESTTTCTSWTPKQCEHDYYHTDVMPEEKDIILFKCRKCGKEITYKKV